MKILVTGAAGFIGFHLSKKLLSLNHMVIGIDNLNKAYNPVYKKNRLQKLRKNPRFIYYRTDILNLPSLKKIFALHQVEIIFHLAARTGVRASLQYPTLYQKTNVMGTKNLYELAYTYGTKQFLFTSSSSVYGNTKAPFTENAHLSGPTSPYAESKQKAEQLLRNLYAQYEIPVTIFRFFSVYGPHGRPDMAPYIFTEAILDKNPLTLYGDGNQSRDYTYIDDIITGLTSTLSKNLSFEIINLGNNKPVSINTLIQTIAFQTHMPAKIIRKPKRKEEMKNTWADITKAEKLLNWKPKTYFAKGMRQFIEWYKKERFKKYET